MSKVTGALGLTKDKSKSSSASDSTGTRTGVQGTRLALSQAGIDKLIQDVLGQADGLASIFAGEQSSGLYNSTAANQAAGDLAVKIAGELAKLTATTVTTQEENITESSRGSGTKSNKGFNFGFDMGN